MMMMALLDYLQFEEHNAIVDVQEHSAKYGQRTGTLGEEMTRACC